MRNVISTITLLNRDQIYFHEAHEEVRLDRLSNSIIKDGYLNNPPIVSKINDDKYLLIDGAHRTKAIFSMGCNRLAVQVVQDEDIKMNSWNHLLECGPWLETLKQDSQIIWNEQEQEGTLIAKVTEGNGGKWYLYKKDVSSKEAFDFKLWHRIVNMYQNSILVHRVPQGSQQKIKPNEVLLSYPGYSLQELKHIVTENHLLPAGVTRSIVTGRLLNLRVPLSILLNEEVPQNEWNALCKSWSEKLRFYNEPIYLCEI